MTVTDTPSEERQPDSVVDSGPSEPIRVRALIVGTGFSGIGAAIALQKMGVPFLILEKAGEMGGTWRDNTYPGAACDVPTHLYSFSFEPRSNWEQLFSRQPEIFDYLKEVAAKYGLYRHVTFNTRVTRGYWDDSEYRWHVFTESGQEYICQFLISGVGALHIPSIPEIEGLDGFEGPVFHSAQWNHDFGLAGKKVAVIGTGASAIQFVPEIVGQVSELKLFQRTAPWVLPRSNVEFGSVAKRAFANIPGLRALFRSGMYFGAEAGAYAMNRRPALLKGVELLGRAYIKSQISDPEVRRKVTPDYRAGCKRLLGSATYYKAIENAKTELVTESITRVTADGIVTSDGIERKVDAIIFGTGFHVTDSYKYLDLKGQNGEDLGDRWSREGVTAHRGITIAGMPNLFFLLGPNTGLGHNSIVFMIESQIHYVTEAIKHIDAAYAQAIVPTREAQDRFNAEVQRKLQGSVWNNGGCQSWYLDEHGKNRTLWSGFTFEYWSQTRKVDPTEYEFEGAVRPAVRKTVPLADGPRQTSPSMAAN
ncbi:flavin-containing monooxygenase [Mycobacteroides salmoniphilum]|uniref:flavin-containing monooxygenase n=1 Tax=Mycobacteroides salmoniphilum TaxID=404941 RepID=UPI000994663D|nr:NAD(P)/FAD-dependent oxidoreductase [Mycobacteroides salmoniphilum]QCH25451.1 4-hydroxyacetophenone monooxygenase [Mycobacteroides salmoniphilum]